LRQEPWDAEVGDGELLAVPHDVVSAAEQNKIADLGNSAVGASPEMVHVAEGGWLAAALGDAASVAGGDGTTLTGGDLVGQRGEADDLTVLVEHDPLDLRVAQERRDLSAGDPSTARRRSRHPGAGRGR
jgi:hypothetical protein